MVGYSCHPSRTQGKKYRSLETQRRYDLDGPSSQDVANEGLWGSPMKNVLSLRVGDDCMLGRETTQHMLGHGGDNPLHSLGSAWECGRDAEEGSGGTFFSGWQGLGWYVECGELHHVICLACWFLASLVVSSSSTNDFFKISSGFLNQPAILMFFFFQTGSHQHSHQRTKPFLQEAAEDHAAVVQVEAR